MDKDIAVAVLRAFKIINDIGGLQKNLLQVLEFEEIATAKEILKC